MWRGHEWKCWSLIGSQIGLCWTHNITWCVKIELFILTSVSMLLDKLVSPNSFPYVRRRVLERVMWGAGWKPHLVGGAMGVAISWWHVKGFDIISASRWLCMAVVLWHRLLLAWQGTQPTVLQLFLSWAKVFSRDLQVSELINWHKTQQESIWTALICTIK